MCTYTLFSPLFSFYTILCSAILLILYRVYFTYRASEESEGAKKVKEGSIGKQQEVRSKKAVGCPYGTASTWSCT